MVSRNYLWNTIHLKPPKINFISPQTYSKEINALKEILRQEHAKNADLLHRLLLEGDILASFSYRLKYKYRSDKGFKNISKVVKALKSLKAIDFEAVVSLLKFVINTGTCPSSNVICWFLVRLQSYSQILHRVICCSKTSGIFLRHRLRTGHSYVDVIMAIAMLSRIWCLSKYLLQNICENYDKIRNMVDILPKEKNWLPSNYILPCNLKTWIYQGTLDPSSDYLPLEDSSSSLQITTNISDESNTKKTKPIKIPMTGKRIKYFLSKETRFRTEKNTFSKTKHMDTAKWKLFRNQLEKYAAQLEEESSKKRKIALKRVVKKFLKAQLSK